MEKWRKILTQVTSSLGVVYLLIMFGFYKKTLSDKTLPDSFQTVFLIGTFVFIVLLFVIQLHKKTIFLWILTVFCFFILLLVLLATFQNVWLLPFFNVCFDWIKANSVIAIYGAIFLSGGSLYILGKANAHYKIFTKK